MIDELQRDERNEQSRDKEEKDAILGPACSATRLSVFGVRLPSHSGRASLRVP